MIPASQGEVIVEKNVKRSGAKSIPSEALIPIFKQKAGYAEAISTPLAKANLLSVVKKISHPNMKSGDISTMKKQLEQEMYENMHASFLASYTEQLGIDINLPAINKAFAVYQE